MNKLTIGGVALVALIIAGWLVFGSSSIEYVNKIDEEIVELEEDLAEMEEVVETSELTPLLAAEAQSRITKRLDKVYATVATAESSSLSSQEKARLIDLLERIKKALIKYQNTLAKIDEAVLELPENQRPVISRRSSDSNRTSILQSAMIDVATVLEAHIEDVVYDYEAEQTVEEISEDIEILNSENLLEEDNENNGLVEQSSPPNETEEGHSISTENTTEEGEGEANEDSTDANGEVVQ